MKILHLLSQRPESTGSGIYLQAILKESEKNGHTNFLVAGIPYIEYAIFDFINPQNSLYVYFNSKELPFPVVGMSDVMPYESKKFIDLTSGELEAYRNAFKNKISASIQKFKPDIIHSHHLWIMTSVVKKYFPHIPLVTTSHGTDLRQFNNCKHLRKKISENCQKMEHVMALSEANKNEIHKILGIEPKKIHVVGGGFNASIFNYKKRASQNEVQILYVGKINQSKGVPWLLKAVTKLKNKNFHLHLAGSGTGPEKEFCMKLAKNLGDKITIYCEVSHKEVARLMKKSHIFVLPSFFEGLPLVLLEALSTGCRIITTSLPGVLELFKGTKKNYISLINLPELETIDKPFKKDEWYLENILTKILDEHIKCVRKNNDIDPDDIFEITKQYTWTEVFKKIENVYRHTKQ